MAAVDALCELQVFLDHFPETSSEADVVTAFRVIDKNKYLSVEKCFYLERLLCETLNNPQHLRTILEFIEDELHLLSCSKKSCFHI
jgi:hypothetical protein